MLFTHRDDDDDELEDWCVDRETDEQDRQLARGLVPAPGATDGENGLYFEATLGERREAIRKIGDAPKAIQQASAVLLSVHGLAEVLLQDTVRDNDDWVLSIGNSIADQTERMVEFLDRPGRMGQRAQDVPAAL